MASKPPNQKTKQNKTEGRLLGPASDMRVRTAGFCLGIQPRVLKKATLLEQRSSEKCCPERWTIKSLSA